MAYVEITDIDGKTHKFPLRDLVEKGVKIAGMDFGAIMELRKAYLARGGPLPITAESVIKILGEIQIGIGDGTSYQWFCKECNFKYKAPVGKALPCPKCGTGEEPELLSGQLWRP